MGRAPVSGHPETGPGPISAGKTARPPATFGAESLWASAGVGAGRGRAVRVGGPLRPRPGPQRRVDPGDGEGGDLVRRGDARAAVDADRRARPAPTRGEALGAVRPPAGTGRRAEVLRRRRADRAGDVPGARVDRLDLAAVALAAPGRRAAPRRTTAAPRPRRCDSTGMPSAGQRHVARRGGRRRRSRTRPPAAGPRLQAAVEDPDVGQPTPAQQPPGARPRPARRSRRRRRPGRRRGSPSAVPLACSRCTDGQRMPALGGRRRIGQLGVEVDEDRAGQVTRRGSARGRGVAERPADVEQRDAAAARQAGRRARPPGRLERRSLRGEQAAQFLGQRLAGLGVLVPGGGRRLEQRDPPAAALVDGDERCARRAGRGRSRCRRPGSCRRGASRIADARGHRPHRADHPDVGRASGGCRTPGAGRPRSTAGRGGGCRRSR